MQITGEEQFPLGEGLAEEKFPVLVMWQDESESPSQAVMRLNAEVLETAHRASNIDDLAGFVIERKEAGQPNEMRSVRHKRCGLAVATLAASDVNLGLVVEGVLRHDCTAEALVHASQLGAAVAKRAIRLLDGAEDSMNPEYLRALAEMVCDGAGLPSERKEEVADFLWGAAATYGDRPTI